MSTWTTTFATDENGEAILVIPLEALAALGWQIGDTVQIAVLNGDDGADCTITLTKVPSVP